MEHQTFVDPQVKGEQTPQGESEPATFKFNTTTYQVTVSLNQFQQELQLRLLNFKNRNIYEVLIDDNSLPEELKMFLNNIKTVYDYIEVNKEDSEKVNVGEGGEIHFIFLMSFGPNSQMRKQIVVSTQLKEVGSVDNSNIKQNFDKLREEIIEINRKYDQEKKKTKAIIANVERANQKLVIESQGLKLENIQFRHQLSTLEEKTNSLEVLVANLYQKFNQKGGKVNSNSPHLRNDLMMQSEIQNLPIPDACRGHFSDMSSKDSMNGSGTK